MAPSYKAAVGGKSNIVIPARDGLVPLEFGMAQRHKLAKAAGSRLERLKAPTSILAESAGANSKACHCAGFLHSAAPSLTPYTHTLNARGAVLAAANHPACSAPAVATTAARLRHKEHQAKARAGQVAHI